MRIRQDRAPGFPFHGRTRTLEVGAYATASKVVSRRNRSISETGKRGRRVAREGRSWPFLTRRSIVPGCTPNEAAASTRDRASRGALVLTEGELVAFIATPSSIQESMMRDTLTATSKPSRNVARVGQRAGVWQRAGLHWEHFVTRLVTRRGFFGLKPADSG